MSRHYQEAIKMQAPWPNAAAVTPNDSADLPYPASALLVSGPDVLKITTQGGQTLVISAAMVTLFPLLEIAVARVWATGTSATDIVAVW